MLPNMVVAVFVLGLYWLLAIVIGRLVHRVVLRLSSYRHVATLMARLSRLMVFAAGVLLALNALSLDRGVASMLAGVGIAGLALGLAAKDTGGLSGRTAHAFHSSFPNGPSYSGGEFHGLR
jgi:small conductance mechanosensitive channel